MATFRDLLNAKKANDAADTASDDAIASTQALLAKQQTGKTATAEEKQASDLALASALFARKGDLTDNSATPALTYRSTDGTTLVADVGINLDDPADDSTPPVPTPAPTSDQTGTT